MKGRIWARVGLLGVLCGTAAGCDGITGSSERNEARVEVRPLGGAEGVSMITSTSFGLAGERILLVESDTQSVSIPSTLTFPLDGERRFYVSVGPRNEGDTASVRMEVWIDDVPWFLDERTLGVDSIGTMTFVYRFTQPRL